MSRADNPSLGGRRLRAYLIRDDTVRVIRVTGEVDVETAAVLRDALRTALDREVAELVVDFDLTWEVAPVAAVAALRSATRVARRRGVAVRVAHAPAGLRRALLETYVRPDGPVAAPDGAFVRLI